MTGPALDSSVVPGPPDADARRWQTGYVEVPDMIERLLGSDGIQLTGRRVAVVDSGDGIAALALVTRLGAARVDGFDDAGCNTVTLATWAKRYAGLDDLPDQLRFLGTRPYELPGDEGAYDLAVWWEGASTRRDPVRMLSEIRRLLAPQALVLMRVPTDGTLTADELHQAVLAAALHTVRVDVDAVTVRPALEDQAESPSGIATRGARLLAYRPG